MDLIYATDHRSPSGQVAPKPEDTDSKSTSMKTSQKIVNLESALKRVHPPLRRLHSLFRFKPHTNHISTNLA
jgi:hypothetical protein